MKSFVFCVSIFASFSAFSDGGPTGIGGINIGMSKTDYQSAIGINPVDCNAFNGLYDKFRNELRYITPEAKTLCWSRKFKKTGSTENIEIGGISYDVVEADNESSKFINSIGISSKAIFFKDRLISVKINFPKVDVETLMAKYGLPKINNKMKINICKNRIGNEFESSVGEIDAVWTNGEITAILRKEKIPPRETCTDGMDALYYIIEERKQLEPIEAAINNFLNKIAKTTTKDSPF